MSKKKKNKRNKFTLQLDDYYNNGIIEMTRSGNVVSMQNILSDSQNDEVIESIKNNYVTIVSDINGIVAELRSRITAEDPLQLLKFSHHYFLINNLGITSEHQQSSEAINASRLAEYVQSVIISSENHYDGGKDDPSLDYFRIASLVERLYSKMQDFILCWGLSQKDDSVWDGIIDQLVESLLFFFVRGSRYPIIEEKYHRPLFAAHDQQFRKIYGISSNEVTDGLVKMLYSVSQGQLDPINQIKQHLENYNGEGEYDETEDYKSFMNFLGYTTNDVMQVTGWPECFLHDLSYGVGEVETFFSDDNQFSGWPILNLPIHRKPFITVDGKYYCFDYYSLSDSFYRAIQRAVVSHSDIETWKDAQQRASEQYVGELFQKLLPGSTVYRDNYYPINGSLKQMAENDLLIIYERILLIVEVKAGSFVYTSPITDFDSHIASYKTLIEKADHQCERVYEYIENNKPSDSVFYDDSKNKKLTLNADDIDKVYKLSVTVDNINSFAARAEKIGFLKLKSNAISIGLDDLITYSEYFDSPLIFLHYLRQREAATQTPNLQLFDELDHLGMYINYNCYPKVLSKDNGYSLTIFDGFREELDAYFGQSFHPSLKPEKPTQAFSDLFRDIIACIEREDSDNRIWLSSYLLDFDADSRSRLCKQIDSLIRKQANNHRMLPIICGGGKESLRFCVYVSQPETVQLSESEKQNHLFSILLHNDEPNRVRIDIEVNNEGQPIHVSGKEYYRNDIPEEQVPYLKELGTNNPTLKFFQQMQTRRKIGRNEPCPCGSGKKYKKCCGRIV